MSLGESGGLIVGVKIVRVWKKKQGSISSFLSSEFSAESF